MQQQHLQQRRRRHPRAAACVAAALAVLAVLSGTASAQATVAARQPPAARKQAAQVVPAAATQAPAVGQQVGALELQQMGDCTDERGLSSAIDKCQTSATLTRPGQSHWYRFYVHESDTAFTLHLLLRTQNGRVRMGVWVPGQKLDEPPAATPVTLLSSSFAQEMYITLPATQLFHSPGSYMLQIINEYGAPQYSLSADVTSGTTLLAEEDRQSIATIVDDCCPTSNGLVCTMLSEGVKATSLDTDLCHQGAVNCDKQGHVTDLVLQGTDTETDLTCPGFSLGFSRLPKLQRLDLAGARLGADLSTIAKVLSPAQQLHWLVLRTAGVTGSLSCDILLPSLSLLSLTRNGLTGTIPDCFTKTTTLKHLYLSDNALSGPLPEFAADSSLQLLFVRNQQREGKPTLDGPLPGSLGDAHSLQYLQLASNALTGGIAGLPADLKYLNVSSNQLDGSLPPLPTKLVSLDVSANAFEGSLPDDMAGYASLVDVQGYYNRLSGPLPSRLPPGLIQLALTGNALSGPLPALPRGMKYLSVAENGLSGPLPTGPGAAQLWFADLSSNAFTGSLPAVLSQSAQLVYLNVSNNQLSGVEAGAAWSTPSLMTLDASYNQIAGPLPAELARQPNLAHISFASNALTGSLGPFAAALAPDTLVGAVFDVSANQLTGPLPNTLGNLAAFSSTPATFPSWTPPTESGSPIKVFNVAVNSLSGPFPAFLYSNLTHIMTQYCSANNPDDCHLWVSINGGNNSFACPTRVDTHSGLLPEDFAHLARQRLGCTSQADGGALYEISSVLQGKPSALAGAASAVPPGAASPELKAAARAAADDKTAGGGVPGPKWWQQAARRMGMPVGAAIGLAVGLIAAVALLGVLGYVVVYRRWWTVRAATRFQKMHEGPLAAAGGATVSSSAPGAGGVAPGVANGSDGVV